MANKRMCARRWNRRRKKIAFYLHTTAQMATLQAVYTTFSLSLSLCLSFSLSMPCDTTGNNNKRIHAHTHIGYSRANFEGYINVCTYELHVCHQLNSVPPYFGLIWRVDDDFPLCFFSSSGVKRIWIFKKTRPNKLFPVNWFGRHRYKVEQRKKSLCNACVNE